jgi:hypothetical protein
MPGNLIERTNYYQRQFLGAEDFKAQAAYHRFMRHRHNLGHHTFGIVVGLELVERTREGNPNARDVFVQPGMAVDGYGREIIVLQPHKLNPMDFEAFHDLRHREVWIAYDEEFTDPPELGYGVCEVDDPFSRIRETFRIVIEPSPPVRDAIVVDGKAVGPPPLPSPDNLTIPPDESTAYQELPDDGGATRWLIRLGSVQWDGGNRQFVSATPARLIEDRQYAGNVTAQILAPAAELRIRDRWTDPLPPLEDDGAELGGVAVSLEGSLTVERLIAAKGDVQIHGRLLDFRDRAGGANGNEFTIRRDESAAGGEDLQIKIGDQSAGENRLAIRSGTTDKVTIADDGTTEIDGNVTVLNSQNLLIDGGSLQLQEQGKGTPDWGLKVDGENLQFIEPDDNDRVVFEILDVSDDLTRPAIRLHGEPNATLSADQLIDLTDGGITQLHTHISATTSERGMVEIATPSETGFNGDSGARLVIPANDPRLLTQLQKNELTGGGLTTLHRHPNGILNNIVLRILRADNGTEIESVDLGSTRRVVALIYLRAMDPRADFDQGDALYADIFRIDGVRPSGWFRFGGDHLGPSGSDSNLLISAFAGLARTIDFRLRSMQDATVYADAVVFFEVP